MGEGVLISMIGVKANRVTKRTGKSSAGEKTAGSPIKIEIDCESSEATSFTDSGTDGPDDVFAIKNGSAGFTLLKGDTSDYSENVRKGISGAGGKTSLTESFLTDP